MPSGPWELVPRQGAGHRRGGGRNRLRGGHGNGHGLEAARGRRGSPIPRPPARGSPPVRRERSWSRRPGAPLLAGDASRVSGQSRAPGRPVRRRARPRRSPSPRPARASGRIPNAPPSSRGRLRLRARSPGGILATSPPPACRPRLLARDRPRPVRSLSSRTCYAGTRPIRASSPGTWSAPRGTDTASACGIGGASRPRPLPRRGAHRLPRGLLLGRLLRRDVLEVRRGPHDG